MNTTTTPATSSPAIAVLQCLPVQDKIPLLNANVRHILAAFHILIMTVSAPANSLVVYLIYYTEQYTNQSTRLIMYLAVCEIFGTISVNGVSTLYMFSYEKLTCPSLLVMHSTVNCSISITYMLILGIAFDRMMKIRFLNDYNAVLTPFRFKLVLLWLSIIATIQSMLIFTGIYFFGYGYATIFSAPIFFISAVFLIVFYMLSIKKLKEMNTVSQRVSNTDRSIVKIASLHLTIFVACITPTLIWQVVSNFFLSKILSETIDILVIFFLYVLLSFHSMLNAFMFLLVNREARRSMINFFHRIQSVFVSNQVLAAPNHEPGNEE